jgi:hypothetical protein
MQATALIERDVGYRDVAGEADVEQFLELDVHQGNGWRVQLLWRKCEPQIVTLVVRDLSDPDIGFRTTKPAQLAAFVFRHACMEFAA